MRKNLLRFMRWLGIRCEETGRMILGYGWHEVEVKTLLTPKEVSISTRINHCDTPVCHGDINMVGCRIKHGGFVLYADIDTNTAEIRWTAIY